MYSLKMNQSKTLDKHFTMIAVAYQCGTRVLSRYGCVTGRPRCEVRRPVVFFWAFSEWPLAAWPACRPATVASCAHLPPANGCMAINSPGQKKIRALRARIRIVAYQVLVSIAPSRHEIAIGDLSLFTRGRENMKRYK